jgi:hypothetical protein
MDICDLHNSVQVAGLFLKFFRRYARRMLYSRPDALAGQELQQLLPTKKKPKDFIWSKNHIKM